MNRKKVYKIASILMVLLWMVIVFLFSNQDSTHSGMTSSGTIRNILFMFDRQLESSQVQNIIQAIEPLIRKLAHFGLYAIGGFLISNLFHTFHINKGKLVGVSAGFAFVYAITDEIHQYFIPGRSMGLSDVLIDTSGALFGSLLFLAIFHITKRIYGKFTIK